MNMINVRLRSFLWTLSLVVIAGVGLSQPVSAVPGVLPPVTSLNLTTSSHESQAKYQTIIYAAKVSKPGTLSHIVMTLPAGATVRDEVRSVSGTVKSYRPGQVIWRPDAPIKVVAGTKLSIPVVGIDYAQPGITNMWLTASDSVGEVLAYARANFTIDSTSNPCRPTGNNYIQTENSNPGASKQEWNIDQAKFDPSNFSAYADAESYKCGDTAYFKVDSKQSNVATATVYRMGYYDGSGARQIWKTADFFVSGSQPKPTIRNAAGVENLIDASNWKHSLGIRIDGRFTPGTYLVKMTNPSGKETYVPFTVRDDSGVKHKYLYQQATTTWHAYNSYGGGSFYSGLRSSHLSFNRPYSEAAGKGSGQFLQLENGLVYWMEQQGYDVAYWTDTDLHTRSAELVKRTQNLILPAHDEYYSYPMRQAVQNGLASKVNLISLGANQIHRPIIYSNNNRVFEVEGKAGTGGSYGKTTFRSRGPAWAEQNITGAQYGCRSHGNIITNNSWLWAGVPNGTVLEGFANGETDYVNTYDFLNKYTLPAVPNNEVIFSAPLTACAIKEEPLRMDIVARTTPSGARVFGGSTFTYACFLNNSCYTTWPGRDSTGFNVDQGDSLAVSRMLQNVFLWADTGQKVAP